MLTVFYADDTRNTGDGTWRQEFSEMVVVKVMETNDALSSYQVYLHSWRFSIEVCRIRGLEELDLMEQGELGSDYWK